jgi:tripartite-type tricarboxylate transporter receptor subunit TctC
VREELTRGGLDPNFMNQKQLTDFVRSENIRVGDVVKNAKISID